MDQGARFPKVAEKAGHYESFYVKACRPGGGRGVWIRHTVHKRPGAEPNASIWFTLFDREAEGPRATKMTVPASELSVPAGGWIRVTDAEIGPGRARGAVGGDTLTASWDLTFSGGAEPCQYLPSERLYDTRLPKTKFVAPFPDARFSGRIEIDEARIELGPWTTRWIPSGMLMLEGEAHRLGGVGQIRAAKIEESAGECSFVLPGKDIVVRGKVSAPKKDFVGWVYADPDGPEHNTINCSVADLELTVERPTLPPRRLTLPAGAAYELGMRETDHGIPIQPYPDG